MDGNTKHQNLLSYQVMIALNNYNDDENGWMETVLYVFDIVIIML